MSLFFYAVIFIVFVVVFAQIFEVAFDYAGYEPSTGELILTIGVIIWILVDRINGRLDQIEKRLDSRNR